MVNFAQVKSSWLYHLVHLSICWLTSHNFIIFLMTCYICVSRFFIKRDDVGFWLKFVIIGFPNRTIPIEKCCKSVRFIAIRMNNPNQGYKKFLFFLFCCLPIRGNIKSPTLKVTSLLFLCSSDTFIQVFKYFMDEQVIMALKISRSKDSSLSSYFHLEELCLTSFGKIWSWLYSRKNEEQLIEECLLTQSAKRTSSIIFGQLNVFSYRRLTSAFLLRGSLSTSLLDHVLCVDVILCSAPVSASSSVDTKFLNLWPCSLDWISKHPWRQISLHKNIRYS